jgi:PRTRC genetic system ThiF family protein
MNKQHYVDEYLLSGIHPITVNLCGVGGNGTYMLSNLAKISHSLNNLGHPGLFVTSFDPDTVTESNVGRQLFSPSEIGINKAIAMTERINRFFGLQWNAVPTTFSINERESQANILITCTDSISSRKAIRDMHQVPGKFIDQRYIPKYWLDIGNKKNIGQVVLGTMSKIKQPNKGCVSTLPTILDIIRPDQQFEQDDTPSCSTAEALRKQDLFINSTLVQLASNLIWKLFTDTQISYHGCYVNLANCNVKPINIK